MLKANNEVQEYAATKSSSDPPEAWVKGLILGCVLSTFSYIRYQILRLINPHELIRGYG